MGVHEELQRGGAQDTDAADSTSASAAEGFDPTPASETEDGDCEKATCSSTRAEPQPFVLPLGVMARNEVYPRTCKIW